MAEPARVIESAFFDEKTQTYDLSIGEAKDIIKMHQVSAPVQPVPIAEELGIGGVWHANFPGYPNYSGMLRREEDGRFHIYTNKSHHILRRRFTMAHEIAHFVLHRDLLDDGVADDATYKSWLTEAQEIQANRLAADILMPWHLLKTELMNFDGVDPIAEMAEKFEVYAHAMSVRLSLDKRDYGQFHHFL